MISAAYQGVEGAYSDVILRAHFGARGEKVETIGQPTFRDVAVALLAGRARFGILPLENTIAGTFREGYDLLAQYDLQPVREVVVRMDHRLLGVPGATLAGLRRVEAHPIVLEECGKFLATLPAARAVPAIDTGVAARDVAEAKDPSIAAIAPPEAAARYGLVELAANIADHPETYTRFLIVESVRPELRTPAESASRRTSVLFSTAHEHGCLARCLSILSEAGVNLSKLESRPKPGRTWEYMFYADFEGDAVDARIAEAITSMRARCTEFRLLGSYDIAAPAEKRAPVLQKPVAATVTCTPAAPAMPAAAKNWPKAARPSKPAGTQVRIGPALVGGGDFVIIAGPCSVESREQVIATAEAVRARGAVMLRGGAFKPRTNPYAFQGLGWDGVDLLAEAGRVTGLPTVSEVMSVDQVERMARSVDVLQIGARNMQNFDLLKAVGRTVKPILLKRGLSATLDELLAAAEYILSEGNPHVLLCERGIRTFETATRNTLDLSAVPVLRERTHLPILVDPSHGVGVRRWIRPLARAAKAVGADGIIVEVHPNPAEAKSDADQALTFQDFEEIVGELGEIPDFGA
ncbi:2-keto-3-deoxy-D-arabino-heptulosonate-7-phosphate synthase I beta [Minicystis rosea]|nr:2-keto-3-deoxy-D-arabino-heptulosonate-7-phosphate synthase I beta [Minicystis rosea]